MAGNDLDPNQFYDARDFEYLVKEEDADVLEAATCAISTYRLPDNLTPGDPVPLLNVTRLEGNRPVPLHGTRDKPLVLLFGSYT